MFRKKDKAKIMIKFQVFPQSHSFYIIYSKAKEISVDDTELKKSQRLLWVHHQLWMEYNNACEDVDADRHAPNCWAFVDGTVLSAIGNV